MNTADFPSRSGRPSSGGQAPCRTRSYSDISHSIPTILRRDASVAVTGSTGGGQELMQSFDRSAWGKGCGPGTNKWDWNRMTAPDTKTYGNSGINFSYMPYFRWLW